VVVGACVVVGGAVVVGAAVVVGGAVVVGACVVVGGAVVSVSSPPMHPAAKRDINSISDNITTLCVLMHIT
jgi:hypothetical protein